MLRAATVANVVLSKNPVVYLMSANEDEINRIKQKNKNAVTIGKRQKNIYTYPNSPSVIWSADLNKRCVLHSSAACGGMLDKLKKHNVLLCGFCNISATADYIQNSNLDWSIVCCGFRGEERNDEDKLCADMITKNINSDQNNIFLNLKDSESLTIFENNQQDYPKKDIEICLTLDMFSLPIKAKENIITKA